MRKFLALLLAFILVISLVACGNAPTVDDYDWDTDYIIQNNTDDSEDDEDVPDEDETEEDVEEETEEEPEEEEDEIREDFKEAMDAYESFMDKYVAFMKKYKENPTDASLLTDYTEYMSEYAEVMEAFEEWEDEDLNAAELKYYTEVQARVSKKLLEVAK